MNTTASITRIASELRPWTARNGSVRYYVNDWKNIMDINVEYHNTGNVKSVVYDGFEWSNNYYKKRVSATKVWFDADGQVHVDYCGCEDLEKAIAEKVTAHFSEEN